MIRKLIDADMDSVLDIWLAASVKAHDFIDSSFWEFRVDDMRNIYLPAAETWVYETDSTVQGFFSLNGYTLAAIFVAPDQQGKGIGRKLLDKARELRSRLTLDVYKANQRTIRFYETCGFAVVSEKTDPHTGHPELVMEYRSTENP